MIRQESDLYLDPRGVIEFDEYERNDYVAKFLQIFNADLTEEQECFQIYCLHQKICNSSDLYIAVANNLSSTQRRALHTYVQFRGNHSDLQRYRNKFKQDT